jgi:pilus assembly protein CpaE
MAELSFVVFSEQEEFAAALAAMLEESGHAQVTGRVTDRDALVAEIRGQRPDALIADLGRTPHDVLDLLASIPAPRPALLLCGPQNENALLLRAMKQGAKEVLPAAPLDEEVAEAVRRLALEHAPRTKTHPQAPVVAVLGTKGGVGATFVACQLAVALQRLGARTALADMHLPLGDVALQLDARPVHTLAHVAREADSLDASLLRSVLHRHPSGLEILAAPARIEEAELVQGEHVERTLSLLRDSFDVVVADVSPGWTDATLRALDQASQVLLVTCLDVATLHHARQHVELLSRLGRPAQTLHIVANRHSRGDAVADRDVEHFVGRPLSARLPNDWTSAASCVNEGRSIYDVTPRSALAAAHLELAHRVQTWCGLAASETEPGPSWISRVGHQMRRRVRGAA